MILYKIYIILFEYRAVGYSLAVEFSCNLAWFVLKMYIILGLRKKCKNFSLVMTPPKN